MNHSWMSQIKQTPHCITYYESDSVFMLDLDTLCRSQGLKHKVQVNFKSENESLKVELQSPLEKRETLRYG